MTATEPASATLDVAGGVDPALLARVRDRPGIVDAAARQTITTRVRVAGEWRRMLLFVVDQEGRGACHTGERSCFFRAFGGGSQPGPV